MSDRVDAWFDELSSTGRLELRRGAASVLGGIVAIAFCAVVGVLLLMIPFDRARDVSDVLVMPEFWVGLGLTGVFGVWALPAALAAANRVQALVLTREGFSLEVRRPDGRPVRQPAFIAWRDVVDVRELRVRLSTFPVVEVTPEAHRRHIASYPRVVRWLFVPDQLLGQGHALTLTGSYAGGAANVVRLLTRAWRTYG